MFVGKLSAQSLNLEITSHANIGVKINQLFIVSLQVDEWTPYLAEIINANLSQRNRTFDFEVLFDKSFSPKEDRYPLIFLYLRDRNHFDDSFLT